MLLHLESLRDFAILQAIRNQANDIFLAARQQRHPVGVVELNWFGVDQCGQNMFNVFVAGPDLSAMDAATICSTLNRSCITANPLLSSSFCRKLTPGVDQKTGVAQTFCPPHFLAQSHEQENRKRLARRVKLGETHQTLCRSLHHEF
jgi:hypothetical protein